MRIGVDLGCIGGFGQRSECCGGALVIRVYSCDRFQGGLCMMLVCVCMGVFRCIRVVCRGCVC